MKPSPLIVDPQTKRLFALVDVKDGTLYASNTSSEFSPIKGERGAGKYSHWEVNIFTTIETAKRSAADAMLHEGVELAPREVTITPKVSA